jgi:hypothetical protein
MRNGERSSLVAANSAAQSESMHSSTASLGDLSVTNPANPSQFCFVSLISWRSSPLGIMRQILDSRNQFLHPLRLPPRLRASALNTALQITNRTRRRGDAEPDAENSRHVMDPCEPR